MKYFTLLCCLALMTVSASGQSTLTVCNSPDCPAAYSTIASALAAASDGDVIHVLASPTNYGDVMLDKAVSIRGAGHALSEATGSFPLLGVVTVGASGAAIEGLYLNAVEVEASHGASIDDVTVRNNRFYGSGRFINTSPVSTNDGTNDWLIEGNVFTPDEAPNSRPIFLVTASDSSWTVRHNYIEQYWPYQRVVDGSLPTGGAHTLLFQHNLVYASSGPAFTLSSSLNASVESNVFWVENPAYTFIPSGSSSNLHFASNLLYSPAGTLSDPDPVYTNTVNVDPEFESLEGGVPAWDYANDFQLTATSPGLGAGLGGQDVGLYGNVFEFSMSGALANLPRFLSVSKAYEILPVGEPLELEVEWDAGE